MIRTSQIVSALVAILCNSAIGQEAKPTQELVTEQRLKEIEALLNARLRNLAKSEPTLCYRMLSVKGDMTVGLAVELCSGTTDALKTVACYEEAFGHPENDGLGLPRGLAVDLCKSNSQDR